MGQDQRANRLARDARHLAAGQRLDVVIGDVEQGAFEVDEVARYMDADDLPRAFDGDLVAGGEAGDDQAGSFGPLALAHEIGAGFHSVQAVGELEQRLPVVIVERRASLELSDHHIEDMLGDIHDALHVPGGGSAIGVSQPLKPGISVQRFADLNIVKGLRPHHKLVFPDFDQSAS